AVFGSGEADGDGGTGGDAEALQRVAGGGGEVAERRQGGATRLDGQIVEGRGGRGLRGVDVQVEAEGSRAPGRNRHRLGQRVGVGGAVAVHPGVPGSGTGRLGRTVLADHASAGRPHR